MLCYSAHMNYLCYVPSTRPAQFGHVADLNYVESSGRRRSSTLSIVPYCGNMWHYRVATDLLLHFGICAFDDIKWQVNGTGRLPPDTLADPLRTIGRACGPDRHLSKSSTNSMIGLWAATKTHAYPVITSSIASGCPQSIPTRDFAHGEASVVDYVRVTPLLQDATVRPMPDLVMHAEATRLATLCCILSRLIFIPNCINSVKTDALRLVVPSRKLGILKAVGEARYDRLDTFRMVYELQSDPSQRFLNAHFGMTSLLSGDPPFRFLCKDNRYREDMKTFQHSPSTKPSASLARIERA